MADATFALARCADILHDERSRPMVRYATFALGLAMGWMARGTTRPSRSVTVTIVASALAIVERIKRVAAIEKDHLEDLVAEARARADVIGQERAARARPTRARDPFDEATA
jgi:hypothetical protein